jgi:Ca2+-transporting ATPase
MWRNGVTFTVDNTDTILYARATTISYLTIAYCQFFNVMSRRFERETLFTRNFWTNKTILWSIVISIAMTTLAVYGPFIHQVLSFAHLSPLDWVYVVGAGLTYLLAFEIMKAFKRASHRVEASSAAQEAG